MTGGHEDLHEIDNHDPEFNRNHQDELSQFYVNLTLVCNVVPNMQDLPRDGTITFFFHFFPFNLINIVLQKKIYNVISVMKK